MGEAKTVPELTSDAETEAFLQSDLSGLDFGQFRPARFEFERKNATVTNTAALMN